VWTVLALAAAIGSVVLPGERGTAESVARPCAADPFQNWLSRATAAVSHGDAVDERAMLVVLDGLGRKRLDRYVVARALASDDGRRYDDDDGLTAELDDAVLTHVLAASPAFRKLVTRPIRPKDPPPPPPVPQVIAPEAQLETANELLEALRETPRPAPRAPKPKPREPDVLYEAARFAVVLRDDAAKARAFLDVYAQQPDVLKVIVENRRIEPAFPGQFAAAVERNLLDDLSPRLLEVVRRITVQLDAQGVPAETIEALAARQPDTLADLVTSRWPFAVRDVDSGGWVFEARAQTILARREAGHFVLSVKVPLTDLLLAAVAGEGATAHRVPDALLDERSLQRLRDCHRSLCLPKR
jgi:hypothetical protein